MGTMQGRWVSWENSFFRETSGTRVLGWGCVVTTYEHGHDPSVEGPCGYHDLGPGVGVCKNGAKRRGATPWV